MQLYAVNRSRFFADYAAAHGKMTTLGVMHALRTLALPPPAPPLPPGVTRDEVQGDGVGEAEDDGHDKDDDDRGRRIIGCQGRFCRQDIARDRGGEVRTCE